MSKRETKLLLEDILEAIKRIQDYTDSIFFEQFSERGMLYEATLYNFGIIGEAVSRTPSAYKQLHPEIEWMKIKDYRNILIHEYFGVNDLIVWDTIKIDLPDLNEKIKNLFNKSDISS
jgi:uncharacterized protein with HEPN domain